MSFRDLYVPDYEYKEASDNYCKAKARNQLLEQKIKFLKGVLKADGYQISLIGKSAKVWKVVKVEGGGL